MKTFNSNSKLSFGMSVATVKRTVSNEPELILNATPGSFRISAAVTRALGIANGEYAMFIHNMDSIDNAISQEDEALMAWCAEAGVDPKTPEGIAAIHEEFDMWGIAKGIQEFDAKGNPVMTRERFLKADRIEYVKANFEEVYKQAIENCDEEFKAALTVEGITEKEQIEMLADLIKGDEVAKYRGAKCANSADLSGIGNVLTFSDAGSWSQLKSDLSDAEAKSVNRIFTVNIKELMPVVINNGYEDITVKVALLTESRDEKPLRRGKKAEEAGEAVE